MDRPHRFFAKPASALGWEVVGAPTIIGPKGPQSTWISRRPEREGRGIFTTHLIAALSGEADLNHDGYVTANEIGTFVTPRVTEDSDAQQTPQSGRLEGEGEIAFKLPAAAS